jgi:receptor protein-tyrosine kinase
MSIIEQAAKRLEELRRSGVDVPWTAAGLTQERLDSILKEGGGAEAQAPGEVVALSAGPTKASRPVRAEAPAVHIDLERLSAQGYLVPNSARSDLAMEFRQIKRPILRNVAEGSGESRRNALIMVTSALPGEGKTFCSVNLAMSIAMEVDTSVLLVDADVVRPMVMQRLGLPDSAGLMDVLTDEERDLGDVILRTNVPKLSLLPAGSRNALATEQLASEAMERLLTELATRYPDRVIILDAPPLLITSEARVLAAHVGQVLVVVDSSKTTESDVEKAFGALEHCPLVMSVLNKCSGTEQRRGYEYGYE